MIKRLQNKILFLFRHKIGFSASNIKVGLNHECNSYKPKLTYVYKSYALYSQKVSIIEQEWILSIQMLQVW